MGNEGEPLFSEATLDGACPKCGGHQFRKAPVHAGKAAVGRSRPDRLGGIIGVALAAKKAAEHVECVTCGMRFRKG